MKQTPEILGLGIDFTNDFTQVSYVISETENDPISMSVIPGEQKYLIPTVLYKNMSLDEWYIGDEAIRRSCDDDRDYITNIPKLVLSSEEAYAVCNEVRVSAEDVVYHFFEQLFMLIRRVVNYDVIHDISVTVETPDKIMIDCVHKVLTRLGYDKENIRVIDHAEAFIYYTTNQKKDIWVNDVVLFDYNKDHFIYRKMKTIKNTTPRTLSVEEIDYSNTFSYSLLEDDYGKSKADRKFFQIIQENFRKSIISAVFLTGTGFYEDWAIESLPELCSKRRVFKGYNLFVKGAAHAAMKRYKKIESGEYLFDCIGRTKVNINLLIMHNGRNMSLTLSKAGTNWYEAGAVAECILDDINRIQIIVEEPISMMHKNVSIELSGFPDRPNKTTRVKISLAYVDDINCIITVEDMGFGEFFQKSDMVITKALNIEGLF